MPMPDYSDDKEISSLERDIMKLLRKVEKKRKMQERRRQDLLNNPEI